MKEEDILKSRLKDLATKAYNTNSYMYSNFLNLSEIDEFLRIKSEIDFIQSYMYGGHPSCERQVVRFGSEEEFGYNSTYPITTIKVSPLIEKFADNLNHRDFLGAILNLGIERDVIGDIKIVDNTGYIYCLDKIAQYILDNLTKIKHTHIKCEIVETEVDSGENAFEDISAIVASLRLDVVIAAITKLSRKQVLEQFHDRKIYINNKLTTNNSYILKDDDIVVIRGYGKYIFDTNLGQTRKNKYHINIKKYI